MARRRPQSWTRDLSSGESTRFPLSASQQAVVAIAELVDWAAVDGADESVRLAVHANTGEETETFVLSAESPLLGLRSPVMNQEFSLEVHSAAHAVVRLYGFLLTVPPEPGTADDELDMSCPGDDVLVEMEYVPEGWFLGGPAPLFAAAGCTAGCMRVAAVEDQEEEEADSKEILVLYRYAPFLVSSDGVVARGSTRAHLLRFMATGDHTARSLAWAGSSLVRLIYPGDFSEQLQELWSSLAAQVSVLPRAARVEVFVDVGILRRSVFVHDSILRRSYYTPERVEWMRPALEDMVEEPWPWSFTGMELHLPEPMRRDHDKEEAAVDNDTDAGERSAKRRRVVAAGEDCPICLQLLKGDDLTAWRPGCGKPHVFHGACLERVLVESKTCPICRRALYVEPK